MAAVFFDDGIKLELLFLTLNQSGGDLKVRLFTNPTTIGHTNVFSDFTPVSSVTFPAYADPVINPLNWTQSFSFPLASAVLDTLSFTFGAYVGTVTVHGYIVYQTIGPNTAMWGEIFSTPFVVPNIGATFDLDLTYQHEQCP